MILRVKELPDILLCYAEEATNAIRLVMKGDYKSAKGYFWKKGNGKPFIDLSGYERSHFYCKSGDQSGMAYFLQFIKNHQN